MYIPLSLEEEKDAIIDRIIWNHENHYGQDHKQLIKEVEMCKSSNGLEFYWRLLDKWNDVR